MTDHPRIWLEPHIGRSEDRLWCEDKAWEDGTEYVRADLAEPYFSKELHEEGVKALARVTHERDVWQGKAKYYGSEMGKAKAELEEYRDKLREAEAEIERLRQAYRDEAQLRVGLGVWMPPAREPRPGDPPPPPRED